jgi:type IV pilus assembly protein PilN
MIRFNFLPWREDDRRQKKQLFRRQLLLCGLLGMSIVFVVWFFNEQRVQTQAERNGVLISRIALLDTRLQEIASLKRDIQALQARQGAVEALQRGRHQPVQLFQALALSIPEGVMLKSLTQGERLMLSGYSVSNGRVSELLRNLDPRHTRLLTAPPELLEIKSASVGEGKELRKLFEFMLALPPANAATAGDKR